MKKTFFIFLLFIFSFSLFAEAPIVHNITATPEKNKKISIVWTLPENPDEAIKELLVYRSIKQISSYSQLEDMTPIASVPGNVTAYIDTVSDFSDYFYAVVAVTTKPYDLILLSFNSTVTGVHLKFVRPQEEIVQEEEEKLYPEGTLREIPLPYIDITDNITQKSLLSDEAVKKASSLITSKKTISPLLTPYVFEEDLISPDGGDDYLLFNILKTTFVQRKYKDAISQLEKMTGTNISESTRNRAYFYLGESYYFQGKYSEAVKTFVRVRTVFPSLVKKWLDSSLDRISY